MKQLSRVGKIASLLFFLSVLGLAIGLRKCNNSDGTITRIEPIRSDLDIPFRSFYLDASKDTTLITETGTSLRFFPGTLVAKNGEVVRGSVEIKVREFHDASAILRAGIPMRLRSDRNAFLQSSGMIEIRAFQNGQELEIKTGKSINTDLAAYRSSKDHQLYFLSGNTDWQKRDSFITKSNMRKQGRLSQLVRLKSELNKKVLAEDLVLELYGDEEAAPELEPWRGQKWKIAKENITPAVLEAIRINWDSVRVIKVNEKKLKYKLAFSKSMYLSSENPSVIKRFIVEVVPFIEKGSKEDVAVSMKNRFLKEDSVKKELEDEIVRLGKEADLLNSFKINRMGIWNVDKALKLSDFTAVRVSFDFQSSLKKSQRVRLFCVLKDDNSVVDFPDWQSMPIYLSATRPMQVVAILPNGNMAYVEHDLIRQQLSRGVSSINLTTKQQPIRDYLASLAML
jgi:hypothetical protein